MLSAFLHRSTYRTIFIIVYRILLFSRRSLKFSPLATSADINCSTGSRCSVSTSTRSRESNCSFPGNERPFWTPLYTTCSGGCRGWPNDPQTTVVPRLLLWDTLCVGQYHAGPESSWFRGLAGSFTRGLEKTISMRGHNWFPAALFGRTRRVPESSC